MSTTSEFRALQPYQQRVLDERLELEDRIEKLGVFLMAPGTPSKLGPEEMDRLNHQYVLMVGYWLVLDERIGAF